MGSYEWQWISRNYDSEKKERKLPFDEVADHPLKPFTITVKESKITSKKSGRDIGSGAATPSSPATPAHKKSNKFTSIDPLSSALDGLDPLSQFATDPLSQMVIHDAERKQSIGDKKVDGSDVDSTFEPWSAKRCTILNKYTTSEKLSIVTSFLSGGDKVVVKTQNTVTEKVKNRLEQLDDFEEGSVKEMLNLSQQEYVTRIDELSTTMKEAWNQDQRVKALKIVIQCSKLLADTNVVQFYPSKFVLITDILDTFGRLVYERIHSKAQFLPAGSSKPVPLQENFTPDQVPESAKETCRNWFFKISSIRELIPRFYVEAAILKSYSFLSKNEISKALIRLTAMIRGIGDPLIAIYAQCYISRVGVEVAPNEIQYIKDNFDNFLVTYSQLNSHGPQRVMSEQRISVPLYLMLYSPALDWILQCLARNANESLLAEILEKCKNKANSTLLLNSIMSAFKPEYIASRSLLFIELMRESDDLGFPRHVLFRTLGLCLVIADPVEEEKLQVLNEVWKVVTKLKDPSDYISCAEIWIEYPVKHFTKREVNTFLSDIIKHMTPDRAFEKHYHQLSCVADKILSHMHDFSTLFSMEKFLPFIDMFQKESVKVDVCKLIMNSYSRHQLEPTNDAVITNAVMFICKVMHDSANALTVEDEKRQIGQLIVSFVKSVSFGRDFEQQLSFYVECRASFTNLDTVMSYLVHNVNNIAMETRKIVKGHHTRKTSSFVKACVAYCFITIPSLADPFLKLQLYLVSGQVALLNQCLSQSDAFFRTAVGLIAEIPKTMDMDGKIKSTEPMLISFINNFLSTLLVVPDHPDHGALYLVRGLLNVLHDYTWDSNCDSLIQTYINVLCILSAFGQEYYEYHIEKIDSNDSLYGSDPKFLSELKKIGSMLIEQILTHLRSLDDDKNEKRLCALAFDLLHKLIAHGDMSNNSMSSLVVKLWNLAHKTGKVDHKLSARILEYTKRKGSRYNCQGFGELSNKLRLQFTL